MKLYKIDRTKANPTDEELWQHLMKRDVLHAVADIEGVTSYLISGEFDSVNDMLDALQDERIITILKVT